MVYLNIRGSAYKKVRGCVAGYAAARIWIRVENPVGNQADELVNLIGPGAATWYP